MQYQHSAVAAASAAAAAAAGHSTVPARAAGVKFRHTDGSTP